MLVWRQRRSQQTALDRRLPGRAAVRPSFLCGNLLRQPLPVSRTEIPRRELSLPLSLPTAITTTTPSFRLAGRPFPWSGLIEGVTANLYGRLDGTGLENAGVVVSGQRPSADVKILHDFAGRMERFLTGS